VSHKESQDKESTVVIDKVNNFAATTHNCISINNASDSVQSNQDWIEKFPKLSEYIEFMIDVPAGEFMMGSPDNNTRISEGWFESEWFTVAHNGDDLLRCARPIHKVKLSPFSIGQTPVTVGLWKEYCVATGTQMPSEPSFGWNDDHPLVNVSWNDANGNFDNDGVFVQSHFLEWIKQTTGLNLSLPTEAQWEYAARAGDTSTWFWEHMKIAGLYDLCDGHGIHGTVSLVDGPGIETYTGLSSAYSRANRWRLIDMIGNVWELCRDCFAPYPGTITTNVVHKSVQVNSGGVLGLFGKKETKSVPTTIHVSSAPPLTVNPFRPVVPHTDDHDEEYDDIFNVTDCVVRGGSWSETLRLNYEAHEFSGEPSVVFAYPFRAGCSVSERNHSLGFRLVSATVSPWATAMELLEKEMD
jgi:formylglycine-generating enzyme required for sulfatase activity